MPLRVKPPLLWSLITTVRESGAQQKDRDITYRLQEAGMLLGRERLDHIVLFP